MKQAFDGRCESLWRAWSTPSPKHQPATKGALRNQLPTRGSPCLGSRLDVGSTPTAFVQQLLEIHDDDSGPLIRFVGSAAAARVLNCSTNQPPSAILSPGVFERKDRKMMTLLVIGLGVLLLSLASVLIWRSVSRVGLKWFGVGALLWVVAVPPKLGLFWLASPRVIGHLKEGLPYPYFIAAAGLYVGAVSSAFEMGVTWTAARLWPRLGRDAGRAIAIGLGAGAFEALLLGLAALAGCWP